MKQVFVDLGILFNRCLAVQLFFTNNLKHGRTLGICCGLFKYSLKLVHAIIFSHLVYSFTFFTFVMMIKYFSYIPAYSYVNKKKNSTCVLKKDIV